MKNRLFSLLLIICLGMVLMFTGCSALKSKLFSKEEQPQKQEQQQKSKIDSKKEIEVPAEEVDKEDDKREEASNQQGKKIMLTLYFTNADHSAIPSEKREVLVKDGAVMRAAVEALIEGPKTKGLVKAIPEGTKILGMKRDGTTAVVDFSKEYSTLSGTAEIVQRGSIVNTLTSVNGIEKVRILVQGKELIGPSGKPFGDMSRFAVDSKGKPVQGEKKTLTLYFGNSNADAVAAEKREVTVNKGDSLEKIVFEELKKGPKQAGHHPVIPTGTVLLSAATKDGVCTLNLSQQFVDNHKGGSAGESMTVYSIVDSLTEIPGVKKVQFLINGKKLSVYLHMSFDAPIERNEEIIQK
ncbi:MAG: GerMN domain-containing protein [Clostridia bacterium]|nr:GerMN domain-containing protein [Clostridia bacterium]